MNLVEARLMLTGGVLIVAGFAIHAAGNGIIVGMFGVVFLAVGVGPTLERLAAQRATTAANRPVVVSPSHRAPAQPQRAIEAFSAAREVHRRADRWKMVHDMQHGHRSHAQCPWCQVRNEETP